MLEDPMVADANADLSCVSLTPSTTTSSIGSVRLPPRRSSVIC